MADEVIAAKRTIWMSVLASTRHADIQLADKIAGCLVETKDWGINPWLILRLKLVRAVQAAFEQEAATKLTSPEEAEVPESEVEINITAAEALFMDLSIQETAWKGALTFKRELWKIMSKGGS